jgi:G protein beta subunit-like protein
LQLTRRIWDIPSLNANPVATLEGHTANVTALAYSAKGKWIVTGSEDGTVKVWDTRWVIRRRLLDVNTAGLTPDPPWFNGITSTTHPSTT